MILWLYAIHLKSTCIEGKSNPISVCLSQSYWLISEDIKYELCRNKAYMLHDKIHIGVLLLRKCTG